MKKIIESKIAKASIIFLLYLGCTTALVYLIIYNSKELLIKGEDEVKSVTGIINIASEIEEFDQNAKELSTEEEMNATSLNNESKPILPPASSSTTIIENPSSIVGSQGTLSSQTSSSQIKNYASLTGQNLKINEGADFNPLEDLKICAIDIDGTNITNKVTFIKGNVNTNQSGHYAITAQVPLQNNTQLIQTFYVEVIEKPLQVTVSNIKLDKNEVEQNDKVHLNFSIVYSKSSVIPQTANINGVDYPIIKQSNTNFSVELTAPSNPQTEYVDFKSIKMSDGTIISVNNKTDFLVLKKMPTIERIGQTLDSKTGKLKIDFNISDFDGALKVNTPLTVILYNHQGEELQSVNISPLSSVSVEFDVPRNGKYGIKILGELSRGYGTDYKLTQLYDYSMLIDIIDKTSLEGNDITIEEGQEFDAIRDLNLKATNENGEDITSSISLEGEIDVTTPGTYAIKASILKLDGNKLEKLFYVTVEPVATYITSHSFASSQENIIIGNDININLDISLSKKYLEVERVIINDNEYVVEKLDTSLDQKQYQVSIPTSQINATNSYELTLSKVILSNGEQLMINDRITINLMNIVMYNQPLLAMNDELEILSQTVDNSKISHIQSSNMIQSLSSTSNDTTIVVYDRQYNSDLTITGEIYSDSNMAPVGQINITLPTAAGFAVDSNSTVIRPSGMKIKNDTTSTKVDVSIATFNDSTPTTGIVLHENESALTGLDRSNVFLTLGASAGQTVTLTNKLSNADLVSLEPGDISSLTLDGTAGKEDVADSTSELATKGISENFTLIFKIEKSH